MVYHSKTAMCYDTVVPRYTIVYHCVPWYTSRNYHASLDMLILQSTLHGGVAMWYYHLVVPRYAMVGYYQVLYHSKTKRYYHGCCTIVYHGPLWFTMEGHAILLRCHTMVQHGLPPYDHVVIPLGNTMWYTMLQPYHGMLHGITITRKPVIAYCGQFLGLPQL